MRGDLSVRINDGTAPRRVTPSVRGLRFRKTVPGGHADASFKLLLPRDTFRDLGPADRIWVDDSRTGRVVWEGFTNNPGALTGPDGEGYEISALGGVTLANDRAERLIYLDTSYDNWVQDFVFPVQPTAVSQVSQFPDTTVKAGTPALFGQFPPGQPIDNGYRAAMRYRGFVGSPMHLGGIFGVTYAGATSAGGAFRSRWNTPTVTVLELNASTTLAPIDLVAGVDFTAASDADSIGFVWLRATGGATNITTDNIWSAFGEVRVLGHLVDKYGALKNVTSTMHYTAGTTTTETVVYLLAHEVAEDLLGRVMTFCDPARSVVETGTTFPIDQLAYQSVVRASQVLDDLSLYEPDYLWEILESETTSGLFRFNYRAWPTQARYLIPPSIVVEQPGGDFDLCNRIAINWTDENGDLQTTIRTTYVAELGSRIRDAEPISLPAGQGSLANAQQIGDQILKANATPPRAGTAVVDRPIMDLLRGAMIQPWEIEPGYLARVVATGDDLRLTELEYDDDSCSSRLTLGDPVPTVEQRVARLAKVGAK